ncbi:MAG: hypothetical protein JST42_20645 [Bacteroidetes bacterium]|nr:hypothetical protein [Bacteroidota bacterium]
MNRLRELRAQLKEGNLYRRSDISNWSKSPDRHLAELVKEGMLEKVSPGLYYYPKKSIFGKTPPEESRLVRGFLKDDRFLITSPNAYNSLGVGTTQLYNRRVVYNHKRHGMFTLGNQQFAFRVKPHFPTKLTEEFLLVDLVNNVDSLAEDKDALLQNVTRKVAAMDRQKLARAVKEYGSIRTQKFFESQLKTV